MEYPRDSSRVITCPETGMTAYMSATRQEAADEMCERLLVEEEEKPKKKRKGKKGRGRK